MAREGLRFTQYYSGAPVCAPSRWMLMTGKHAGHSYIQGNYEMGGFEDTSEGGNCHFMKTHTLLLVYQHPKNSGQIAVRTGALKGIRKNMKKSCRTMKTL